MGKEGKAQIRKVLRAHQPVPRWGWCPDLSLGVVHPLTRKEEYALDQDRPVPIRVLARTCLKHIFRMIHVYIVACGPKACGRATNFAIFGPSSSV